MLWRGVAFAFAAGLLTAPAMAADTVKPAPVAPAPKVVAPVDYFSGLYAGVHGGWGWSNATSKYANTNFDPPYCGYYWGCPVDVDPAGAFVGGQIGVNHVLSSGLLLGIQGDYSFASLEDDGVSSYHYGATQVILKVDQMATIEARLGIVHGQWLPFVTAGWGWAHAERSAFNPVTLPTPDVDKHWHSGWTAGAGLQYAINTKWSVGAEYRYFNGGTQTYGLGFAGGTKVSLNIQTVRFSVNLKF